MTWNSPRPSLASFLSFVRSLSSDSAQLSRFVQSSSPRWPNQPPSSPRRQGRVRTRTVHGVHPLPINPNRSVSELEWRIKTASLSNPPQDKAETSIYRRPYCPNFDLQEPNPRAWTKLFLWLDFATASAIGARGSVRKLWDPSFRFEFHQGERSSSPEVSWAVPPSQAIAVADRLHLHPR
jgi:hypothetical protein